MKARFFVLILRSLAEFLVKHQLSMPTSTVLLRRVKLGGAVVSDWVGCFAKCKLTQTQILFYWVQYVEPWVASQEV